MIMTKLLWLGFLLVAVSADCDVSCLSCGADGTCQACAPNAQLSNGVCSCSAGSYPRATVPLSCDFCDPSCLACSGPSEFECLSCPPETAPLGPTPSRCVCPTDPSHSFCSSCYQTCTTCDYYDHTVCLSCQAGFELYSGSCVPTVHPSQPDMLYTSFYLRPTESVRAVPDNRREQADYFFQFNTLRTLSDVTIRMTFPSLYPSSNLYAISCAVNGVDRQCSTDGNIVNVYLPEAADVGTEGLIQYEMVVRNVTNPDVERGSGFFYMSMRANRPWRDDARTVTNANFRFFSREYGRMEDSERMSGLFPYETLNLDTQIWKTVYSKRDQGPEDLNIPFGRIALAPAVDSLLAGRVEFAGTQGMAMPTELQFTLTAKSVLRPGDRFRLGVDTRFAVDGANLACAFLLPTGSVSTSCWMTDSDIEVAMYPGALTDLSTAVSLTVSGITNPPHSISGCTNFRLELLRGCTVLERLAVQGPVLAPGKIALLRRAGSDVQGQEYPRTQSLTNVTLVPEHWIPAGGSILIRFQGLDMTSDPARQRECYTVCTVHSGLSGLYGNTPKCGRFDRDSYAIYGFDHVSAGTYITVSMFVKEKDYSGALNYMETQDALNNTIDLYRSEGTPKEVSGLQLEITDLALGSYAGNASTSLSFTLLSPVDLLSGSNFKVTLPTGGRCFTVTDKLDCTIKLNTAESISQRLDCTPQDQRISVSLSIPLYAGHSYSVKISPTQGGCLGQFRNPLDPGCYPVGLRFYPAGQRMGFYQTAFTIDTRTVSATEAEVFLWTRMRDRVGAISLPTVWTVYYTPGESLAAGSHAAFLLKDIRQDLDANSFRNTYCFRNETEVPYANATLPGFPALPRDLKAYLLYGQDTGAVDGDNLAGFKLYFPTGLAANGTYRVDLLGVAGNGNANTELFLAVWTGDTIQQYGRVKALTSYFSPARLTQNDATYIERANFDKYFPGEVADISYSWTPPTRALNSPSNDIRDMYFALALPSGFQFTSSSALTFKSGTIIKSAQHVTFFNSSTYSLIWGWTDGTVYLSEGVTYTVTVTGVKFLNDRCASAGPGFLYAGRLGQSPDQFGLTPAVPLWYNRSSIAADVITMTLAPANELISDFSVSFPVTRAIPWNGYILLTLHQGFLLDFVQKCELEGNGHHYLCTIDAMRNRVNLTDLGPVSASAVLTLTLDKVRMPNTTEPIEPVQIVTYGCCTGTGCSGLQESKYHTVQLAPAVVTTAKVLKVQYWPVNVGYPGDLLVVFKLTRDLQPRSRVVLGIPYNTNKGELYPLCRILNMTGETWQISPLSSANSRPKHYVSYSSCTADASFVNLTLSRYIPENTVMGLLLQVSSIPSGSLNTWPGMTYADNVPRLYNNFTVWSESFNRTVDVWEYNPTLSLPQLDPRPVNSTFQADFNTPVVSIDPVNRGEYKTFTFALRTSRTIGVEETLVVQFGNSNYWFQESYLHHSRLDNEATRVCWSERFGPLDCQMTGSRVFIGHRTAFPAGSLLSFQVRRPIPSEALGDFPITIWSMKGFTITQELSTNLKLAPLLPPVPLDMVALTASNDMMGENTDIAVTFNYKAGSDALTIKVNFELVNMWKELEDTYPCSLTAVGSNAVYSGTCQVSLAWNEVLFSLSVPANYWQSSTYTLLISAFPNPHTPGHYSISAFKLYNPSTKSTVARMFENYGSALAWDVRGPGPIALQCASQYITLTAGSVASGVYISAPDGFFGSTVQVSGVVKALRSPGISHKFTVFPLTIPQGADGGYLSFMVEDDIPLSDYFLVFSILEQSSLGGSHYSAPADVVIRVTDTPQNVTVNPASLVPIGGNSLPIRVYVTAAPASPLTVTLTTNEDYLIPFPNTLLFGPEDVELTFVLSADTRLAAGDYKVLIAAQGPTHYRVETTEIVVPVRPFNSAAGTVAVTVAVQGQKAVVTQTRSQPGVGYFLLAPSGASPLPQKALIQAVSSGIIPTEALNNALSSEVRVFKQAEDQFTLESLTTNMPYVLFSCLVNTFGVAGPITSANFTVMAAPRMLATVSIVKYAGSDSDEQVREALSLALGAKSSDFKLKEVVGSEKSRFGYVTNYTYYVNTVSFEQFERTPNMEFLGLAAPELDFASVWVRQFDQPAPAFVVVPKVIVTEDSVEVSVQLDSPSIVAVVIASSTPLSSFQVLSGLASDNTDAFATVQTRVQAGQSALLLLRRPKGDFTVWVAAESDIPFYPRRTELPYSFNVKDGVVTQ